MANQILTRLYENHSAAVAAVQALEAAGFDHEHISIVSHHGNHHSRLGSAYDPAVNEPTSTPFDVQADTTAAEIGAGASVGTIVGGGLGLLAGLGTLAIPGLGLVVAAGWLVSTLTGAGIGAAFGGAGGGLVGALIHAGHSEEDAEHYAEGVRLGGTLVAARVDQARLPIARQILDENRGSAPHPTKG